jgi:hypothetical protein
MAPSRGCVAGLPAKLFLRTMKLAKSELELQQSPKTKTYKAAARCVKNHHELAEFPRG